MRRRRLVQLGIILFIAVNFFLVILDDEMRIDRVSYVNNWSESFTTDMKRELYKPVVLSAAGEEQIYFDSRNGIFQEFLVAEGEEISPGTGLFTYRVENYFEAEATILQQIDQVNGEITAIEQAITQMEAFHIPVNDFEPASSVLITEEDIFVELPESSYEAEVMKEQYLVEKEQELATKNQELLTLEGQLTELQQTGDMLTYESPYAGKVKQIAHDLSDPLIVIESMELHATGNLSEQERVEIEEGMPAVLQLDGTDILLEGGVDSLADSPSELAVEADSNYPFTASFLETTEGLDLLPGYHGTLAITVEESLGTTAVFEEAVVNQSVWEMTTGGTLRPLAVETGLYEDHRMEILSGVESDILLAEGPHTQLREGASFITPLQWKQLNRESVRVTEIDWIKPFVSGILSR